MNQKVFMNLGQRLQRRREPDLGPNVEQYDRAEETKLVIAYALGIELMHRCRDRSGGKALDLACGPGLMTLRMAEYLQLESIEGIDLSRDRIERAKQNATTRGLEGASFNLGDVTDLSEYADEAFDLCTFCDAAHHMTDTRVNADDPRSNAADLEVVGHIVSEMDRVTKPDGLVVLMDLARFRSRIMTELYVAGMGFDYFLRNLGIFYHEFRNSMFAAWSADELSRVVPESSSRNWYYICPRGLKSMQFLVGSNRSAEELIAPRTPPWQAPTAYPAKSQRVNRLLWKVGRTGLFSARPTQLTTASQNQKKESAPDRDALKFTPSEAKL